MSEHPDIPEDWDPTAAEYAVGVLDQAERAAAEARLRADPAFAREVEAWQERLYPMAEAVRPVRPSATVWPRIARGIGDDGSAKVVDLAQRRALRFWRGWSAAATAAAAVAILILSVRAPAPPAPATPAVQPVLIAELTDSQGHGFITATYDPKSGVLNAQPNLKLPVPSTRSAELWLIPAGGAPQSLGLIDLKAQTTVKVATALRPGAKPSAILAITWEQPGGSPDGKPHAKPTWAGKLAAA